MLLSFLQTAELYSHKEPLFINLLGKDKQWVNHLRQFLIYKIYVYYHSN